MSLKAKYSSNAQFSEQPDDMCFNGLTPDELAFLAGTTLDIVRELVAVDLINPREHSKTICFDVETVQTVRRILRLQRHLQISLDSMALVFDLLDRIDALEARIRNMEK
jgi:hypothetical protein